MDITEWHDHMRDKYAEKQEREHASLMGMLGILVFFSLLILAYLRYAAK